MGIFGSDPKKELERLKKERTKIAVELEIREAVAKEEELLKEEESRLRELKTPKWLKRLTR